MYSQFHYAVRKKQRNKNRMLEISQCLTVVATANSVR